MLIKLRLVYRETFGRVYAENCPPRARGTMSRARARSLADYRSERRDAAGVEYIIYELLLRNEDFRVGLLFPDARV